MKRFQPIAIISPMYIHLSVAFRYYNIESLRPHHKLGSVSFVADHFYMQTQNLIFSDMKTEVIKTN